MVKINYGLSMGITIIFHRCCLGYEVFFFCLFAITHEFQMHSKEIMWYLQQNIAMYKCMYVCW